MNKLSIVLIGLVITLSMMVSVAAYFSSNPTAYVSAVTTLDPIDFGNVFPGMEVTESFTISRDESVDYIMTLVAPSGGELDIRSLLTVWKDPVEPDDDGPISGSPDYTGTGSFTIPGDNSDTWFVTLTVPDVTLPSGVGYDYGCKISIELVVAPPVVPDGDLVLRPVADGSSTQFDYPTGGNHWAMVDDSGSHDADATSVSNSTDNRIDLYNISDLSSSVIDADIQGVTLYAVMKGNGTTMTNGYFGVKSGANEYWQTRLENLPTSYTYFSRSLIGTWTVAAINNLQVGFYVDDLVANSGLTATQIYVVVDITP